MRSKSVAEGGNGAEERLCDKVEHDGGDGDPDEPDGELCEENGAVGLSVELCEEDGVPAEVDDQRDGGAGEQHADKRRGLFIEEQPVEDAAHQRGDGQGQIQRHAAGVDERADQVARDRGERRAPRQEGGNR